MFCDCLSGVGSSKIFPGSFTSRLLISYCCMEGVCGPRFLHIQHQKVTAISFPFWKSIYIFMCGCLYDFPCTVCIQVLVEARRGHGVCRTEDTDVTSHHVGYRNRTRYPQKHLLSSFHSTFLAFSVYAFWTHRGFLLLVSGKLKLFLHVIRNSCSLGISALLDSKFLIWGTLYMCVM